MAALSPRTARRIKIAVSVALVAGLIWFLDLDTLRASLENIDYSLLLLALLMVLLNRTLMPLKWNLLLRARNIRLGNFDAIRIYTLSTFLGLVLPPTVGADSVRSWYLNRAGFGLSDVVASIVIERVFGFLVLLAFTLGGFLLLVGLLRDSDVRILSFAWLLAVVTLTALGLLFLSFSRRFQSLTAAALGRIKSRRLMKLAGGAEKFIRAYQEYRDRKPVLLLFSGLTALELLLVIVRSYVVALALGVHLPLMVFFAFLPLVTLLNRMPVSFDGFGINEVLFIYFLGLFGVMSETGFLIGLVNHLVFIVGVLPGGIFYVLSGSAAERRAVRNRQSGASL